MADCGLWPHDLGHYVNCAVEYLLRSILPCYVYIIGNTFNVFSGDVRTPTSSGGGGGGGQPVILAERSEEQTYTLIDSNKATSSTSKHQDFLSVKQR